MPFGSRSACMTRGYGPGPSTPIGRTVYLDVHVHAATDERDVVAPRVRRAGFVCIERADTQQQLELVTKVCTHHLGAVGGDRERDAVLRECPERLAHGVLVGERLREQ